jgi:hypothetical protein
VTFEAFWRLFPRKVAKLAAQREWQRLKPDEELQRQIEAALVWQMPRWTDLKFTPHPATWLHQGRWMDEPPQAHTRQAVEDWVCPHLDPCSHRSRCDLILALNNPARYPLKPEVV